MTKRQVNQVLFLNRPKTTNVQRQLLSTKTLTWKITIGRVRLLNSVELQLEHAFSNNLLLHSLTKVTGTDLGGGCRGCANPPPPPEMTRRFLIQLVFWKKKLCGLLVLKKSKRRVHSILKKILDPPLSYDNFFLLRLLKLGKCNVLNWSYS